MSFSASAGKPDALTFGKYCATFPSFPMMTPMRRAPPDVEPGSAAPYWMPTFRSVSHKSGKLKLNFFAKASFSEALSKLTPRTAAPFWS